MLLSGESIRVVHPLFQEERGGSIPTSPLQLKFGEIDLDLAMGLNELWHSRFPITVRANLQRVRSGVNFGAEFDGVFYASAIWTTPIASNRLKDGLNSLELRRLAISPDAPKYTATRMISFMRKWIEKKDWDIKKLISYQDTEVHTGTIYKASGWKAANEGSFTEWTTATRKRNDAQSTAPKIRWEYNL